MATKAGAIVDVSGSMRRSAGLSVAEIEEKWVSSIFKVIDNLIEHDVSSENEIFTIGMGTRYGEDYFDVIHTIEKCSSLDKISPCETDVESIVHDIFIILENSGARTLRNWTSINFVARHITDAECANMILHYLKKDDTFKTKFVHTYLPPECRDWSENQGTFGKFAQSIFSYTVGTFRQANVSEIKEIEEKARDYIKEEEFNKLVRCIQKVSVNSLVSVHKAKKILHGLDGGKRLSQSRIKELVRSVDPFIYGSTPLYQSLQQAIHIMPNYQDCNKLLFVLSDGDPMDEGNLEQIIAMLKNKNVTVVCCFITDSDDVDPQTLYSEEDDSWNYAAKFMFKLSSAVSTQKLPRTLFAKRDWTIHFQNNETKLFVQVNHPDHINDACQLARDVVCSKDALVDILASIDLEQYMYQSLHEFKAKKQDKQTCYANAIATVIHLARKRMVGQVCPRFEDIRSQIIQKYGKSGEDTFKVLNEIIENYHLRCKKVTLKGAMDAVASNRPVLARFTLTDRAHEVFRHCFDIKPKHILTKDDIYLHNIYGDKRGHAIVFTSFSAEYLRFLNSWGMDWGDMGFFRVADNNVLNMEFMDVSASDGIEKAYIEQHGSNIARHLLEKLKGLRTATCMCPECKRHLPVREFSGTLAEVKCPSCYNTFHSSKTEDMLALNIYLASVLTKP